MTDDSDRPFLDIAWLVLNPLNWMRLFRESGRDEAVVKLFIVLLVYVAILQVGSYLSLVHSGQRMMQLVGFALLLLTPFYGIFAIATICKLGLMYFAGGTERVSVESRVVTITGLMASLALAIFVFLGIRAAAQPNETAIIEETV